MTPALVIFDCDGVLVDSEPITARELAADLTGRGFPITPRRCEELFTGGTIADDYRRAIELGADLPDDWVALFYERMFRALSAEVEPIPGAHQAVETVRSHGIAVAIGSNGPSRKMEITLGRTGLAGLFGSHIFSAHHIGIAKPDPRFYAHVATQLGHGPADTVVVEDSATGVRSAKGGGFRCLGYARDTPASRLAELGAETFQNMSELPALLGLPPIDFVSDKTSSPGAYPAVEPALTGKDSA